jgi:hypothetical protein
MFNVFKKKNCKKYVLECLNLIGIDTQHLSSFMELPILDSLETMVILDEEDNGMGKTYYWGSPITFKAKSKNEDASTLNQDLQEKYASLHYIYSRTQTLLTIIQSRQTELASLGTKVAEISKIEDDLLAIKNEIEKVAEYPKLITKEEIFKLAGKLTFCVDAHIENLEAKQLEPNLICILKDILQELLLYIKQTFSSGNKCSDAKLNTQDIEVFDKIQIVDAKMRDQDKERNDASDLLSEHPHRGSRLKPRQLWF